jgi:predicted nucleic acid-binding protein
MLTDRVDQLLAGIEAVPLETGDDRIYAELLQSFEASGGIIGVNDPFVAEFQRVPELHIENWVRP